jgi:hypothetical protein
MHYEPQILIGKKGIPTVNTSLFTVFTTLKKLAFFSPTQLKASQRLLDLASLTSLTAK